MGLLLDQIEWGEPVLPVAVDAAWEAELKRRGAPVFEIDRRVAASHWLREAAYGLSSYVPTQLPQRLLQIGAMVTAQENACRYCYGANRAYLKILGYRESFIQRIELDLHLAELDPKERAFIGFCRTLARSRPRPANAARRALVGSGFTEPQIAEMAFVIAMGCFYNRVSTMIALPPEAAFERLANGPLGRLIGLAAPLTRRIIAARRRAAPRQDPPDAATLARNRFGAVLVPLAGLPAASVMRDALDGAFASPLLSDAAKALMFAVVARALACAHCAGEAARLSREAGMDDVEVETALATLQCDRLRADESALLSWTRETVSYDTPAMQRKTRALAADLAAPVLLEAIGVASLANATVRVAMLLE